MAAPLHRYKIPGNVLAPDADWKAEAKRLAAVQATALASGKGLLDPAKVVTLLVKATSVSAPAKKPAAKGVVSVTMKTSERRASGQGLVQIQRSGIEVNREQGW